MKSQRAKRLKELEGENARLKKLLAEAERDTRQVSMLKEMTRKPPPDSYLRAEARGGIIPEFSHFRRSAFAHTPCHVGQGLIAASITVLGWSGELT